MNGLKQLAENLWVHDAKFPLLGANLGNRMTCIRLPNGKMWLHSPNRFDPAVFAEVSQLGELGYLVAPSLSHNLNVMDWKQHQPAARVVAPDGAKKLTRDLQLSGQNMDDLRLQWQNEIDLVYVAGMPLLQEFAFFHAQSRTLILTDLAFNVCGEVGGWTKLLFKLYGSYGKFGPTRLIKAVMKDKKKVSESLQSVMQWDFDRIVVSHGDVVENDGKAIFADAFRDYL